MKAKKIKLKSFAINKTSFIVKALKLQFLNIFAEQLFHFHLQQCHVFLFPFVFFHLAYSFDLKKSESSLQLFFGYFLFALLPLAQVHLSLILCMPRICWKLSRWSKIGIDASEYTRGSQTQPIRFDPIRFNRSHGIVKPNWCHICIHIRFLLFPPLLIAVWVRLLCAAFVYYPVRCWAIVGCRLFTFKLNTLFHPINAKREREGIEYRHLGSHHHNDTYWKAD